MRPVRAFLSLAAVAVAALASAGPLTITILHSNDLHARVEPAMIQGKPYGGYARQATLIHRLRKESVNPLLLNTGDTFQGTIFFNVYEGLADLAFMNEIGYQAMAVGNHEFDRGPKPLATFGRLAEFPLLAANLDVSADPDLKDLIKPSTVITIDGERVGIVGAVTPDLPTIASPGDFVKMLPLQESVQRAVDDLTRQGVDKIILLTHVGYDLDLELARQIRGADVIVGGHSHSLLGRMRLPGDVASLGSYPTEVRGPAGDLVLVVQAWEWGKIFGKLEVRFDERGRVRWFSRTPPIIVDESIPEDPVIASMIAAFRKPIEAVMNAEIGATESAISRDGSRDGDSVMGSFIADAMLAATSKQGAVAAFMNGGGVRAGIEAGPITYGEALTVQPFSNTLVLLDLTGQQIKDALEWAARLMPEGTGGWLIPSAGTSYRVTATEPVGSRVSDIQIAGAPLDLTKTYRVTFNSFSAKGGDGHDVLKNATGYRYDTGMVDIDALVDYIRANTPLRLGAPGRVIVHR